MGAVDVNVECLRCGERHRLTQVQWRYVQETECPRCGYVGWTETSGRHDRARRTPDGLRLTLRRRGRVA